MGRLTRDSGKGPHPGGLGCAPGLQGLQRVVNRERLLTAGAAQGSCSSRGGWYLCTLPRRARWLLGGHSLSQPPEHDEGHRPDKGREQDTVPLLSVSHSREPEPRTATWHAQHRSIARRAHRNCVALHGETQCSSSGLKEQISTDKK